MGHLVGIELKTVSSVAPEAGELALEVLVSEHSAVHLTGAEWQKEEGLSSLLLAVTFMGWAAVSTAACINLLESASISWAFYSASRSPLNLDHEVRLRSVRSYGSSGFRPPEYMSELTNHIRFFPAQARVPHFRSEPAVQTLPFQIC